MQYLYKFQNVIFFCYSLHFPQVSKPSQEGYQNELNIESVKRSFILSARWESLKSFKSCGLMTWCSFFVLFIKQEGYTSMVWQKSEYIMIEFLFFFAQVFPIICEYLSLFISCPITNPYNWMCMFLIYELSWFYLQSSAACRDEWLQAISTAIDNYAKKETTVKNPEMVNQLIEITCTWINHKLYNNSLCVQFCC